MTITRTALALCFLAPAASLHAQEATADQKPAAEPRPSQPSSSDRPRISTGAPPDWVIHTYYLRNSTQQNDANEILIALRNMVNPSTKIFLVSSDNAIVVYGAPDQQPFAANLIRDLDRPRQSFKVTYTFTEYDNGKRVGIQHHSLGMVIGQRATFKEGSKIPVLTGSFSTPSAAVSTSQQQFQYIDVGLNLDATIDTYANGVRLRTKVEQSSSAEDKAISGIAEPVIRQSVFEGTAILTPGKPSTLGSIEVPGTTRRFDIEVTADPIP